MSYILESIKKAERERKLGQQAPSISIEYTAESLDRDQNHWPQWSLFLLGIMVAAVVTWSATFYFTDRENDKFTEKIHENSDIESKQTETLGEVKREIAMVPVKDVHQSQLKTVKLITEENKVPVPEPVPEIKVQTNKNNSSIKPAATRSNSINIKPASNLAAQSQKEPEANRIQLASIYKDLAESAQQEPIIDEDIIFVEEQVEIETASYVTLNDIHERIEEVENSNTIQPQTKVTPHVQAVNSGVPSYGELPHAIQEKIPEFNVSVHMFHEDPIQRRIRINGQMYTEGKNLEQGLALVEITRYGAVFDFQGYLFRLNVR